MKTNGDDKKHFVNPLNAVVIFFDLEYFVPKENRPTSTKGLVYNPHVKGNFLLGGCFTLMKVSEISLLNDTAKKPVITSFWVKNASDEKSVVCQFFNLLKRSLELNEPNADRYSPLLCGIGITHSDWPALIQLFVNHGFLNPQDAFKFQCDFRTIDLQVLAISLFNSKAPLLYPKGKNELLDKFLRQKPTQDGTAVWELFENGKLDLIAKRTKMEVQEIIAIYKAIHAESNANLELKRNCLKFHRDLNSPYS